MPQGQVALCKGRPKGTGCPSVHLVATSLYCNAPMAVAADSQTQRLQSVHIIYSRPIQRVICRAVCEVTTIASILRRIQRPPVCEPISLCLPAVTSTNQSHDHSPSAVHATPSRNSASRREEYVRGRSPLYVNLRSIIHSINPNLLEWSVSKSCY